MKKITVIFLISLLIFGLAGAAFAADDSAQSGDTGEAAAVIDYGAEQTELLGRIYAILVFFVVVLLCYFSYKFLRIFF